MIFENLIIFEIANSHQGSVEHGLAIIEEMGKITKEFGIYSAVKFQFRDLDSFIHNNFKGNADTKHVSRFENTRLTKSQFGILVNRVKELNMLAVSTPFDENGVDWCVDLGVDIIKIASSSSNDWPLLEKICTTSHPIILSTGGKTIHEIDKIYNFLIHRNRTFSFLHCVSEYPVPSDKIQLNFIDQMKRRYPNIGIGYSGHESPDNVSIPQMAIAKGSLIMERHVGLPNEKHKLNLYSMNPFQTRNWVRAILEARKACSILGENDKKISDTELASLSSLMRGVYLKKDIIRGEIITREDVYFAMPLQKKQTTTSDFVPGIAASMNYNKDEPLREIRVPTQTMLIRSFIHSAKGLLNESCIQVGKNFTLELSHHYGLANFNNFGATILNILNREYCKKIIIVLPKQAHPAHFHKIKEEAFHLLYGELNINIDGKEIPMIPGDHIVILRNQTHSFSSINGAVFEEISTTHVVGDSYYLDSKITSMDLIERKTIVEEW